LLYTKLPWQPIYFLYTHREPSSSFHWKNKLICQFHSHHLCSISFVCHTSRTGSLDLTSPPLRNTHLFEIIVFATTNPEILLNSWICCLHLAAACVSASAESACRLLKSLPPPILAQGKCISNLSQRSARVNYCRSDSVIFLLARNVQATINTFANRCCLQTLRRIKIVFSNPLPLKYSSLPPSSTHENTQSHTKILDTVPIKTHLMTILLRPS
jgi:hypothetical protein